MYSLHLGREAVVAGIYHEHNALNWRLSARTTWTCRGPLPVIAALQLQNVRPIHP
jgi:hypothetical protein